MRLFRRRQDPPPAPDEAPEPSAQDGQDVARPERAPTGDWMTVAPLPATVRPMTPTFRVQTLPEILSSHQSVRLSGDLGHSVSPEAPSGSVQGLAVTNPGVHEVVGHGDLPLRTPHLPEPAPAQPLTIRRLAISDSPEPAAASTPALPEPVVSRVLANPAPLADPPATPLPVARVVDMGMSSPAAAPSSSSSSAASAAAEPAPAPAPDAAPDAEASAVGAPLVGDDRVGGFAVNLEALRPSDSTSELRRPAPPELAPPIQPRTLQRRANAAPRSTAPVAGAATTPPTAPIAPTDAQMPLAISRDTGGGAGGASAGAPASSDRPVSPAPDPPGTTTASTGGTTPPDPPSSTASTGGTTGPASTSSLPTGADAVSAAELGDPAGARPARPAGAVAAAEPDPAPEPVSVQTAPLVGGNPAARTEAAAPAEPGETAPAPLVLRQAPPPNADSGPVSAAPAAATAGAPLLGGDLTATSPLASGPVGPAAGGDLTSASPLASEPAGPPAGNTPSNLDSVVMPAVGLPLHSPGAGPGRNAAPSQPAVQRLAEWGGPSAASPPTAPASTAAHDKVASANDRVADVEISTAPLAGGNPLAITEPAAAAALSPSVASTQDLPLVVPGTSGESEVPAPMSSGGRTAAPAAESAHVEAPPTSEAEPSLAPAAEARPEEPVVVPTLGMGGGALSLQSSPDGPSTGIAGISSPTSARPRAGMPTLPLAPVEQPGTLGAPASAGPQAPAGGSPLARPAPASGRGAGPAATTPATLQRVAAAPGAAVDSTGTSTTTASPLQTALQLPAPVRGPSSHLGTSPASPTSLPLQRLGAGGVAGAGAGAVSAAPVLRRLPVAAGPTGTGEGGPMTHLQRIEGAGAPAASNGAAGSSSTGTSRTAEPLPLHTPAAAVPSAVDVAVKAGLAERQADGTLFYTSPPGGGGVSETVIQRVNEIGPATATPVARAAADLAPDDPAPSAAPGAVAAGGTQSPEELDLLARRLYKRLRSEMQADIAKQLEAKNRAGRYRR